jgi:hypothetical protein
MRRLRIVLEQREVRLQSNAESRPRSEPLTSIVIVDTSERASIPEGGRLIAVPADARPTCQTAESLVSWSLNVKGEITFWPDVEEEFPLTVLPRGES